MPGSNGFDSFAAGIASECPHRATHARAAVAILILGGVTFAVRPGVVAAASPATAGRPAATGSAGASAGATGTTNAAANAFTLATRVAAPAGPAHPNGITAGSSAGVAARIAAGVAAGAVAQPGSPNAEAAAAPANLEARAQGIARSHGSATWSLDLFDARAERWQDPDYTACTAASTLSMLNTISYGDSAADLVWQVTTSYTKQESILAFERTHMTMLLKSKGTDTHGWRNALNFYGWGSTDAGVYVDAAFSTFDAAEKAAVSALAIYRKPVGILAAGGSHAEFITGYRVSGDDPGTGSNAFTVQGVYLTDPYSANHHRDTWITAAQWKSTGGKWVRFSPYVQVDSPYRDPLDGQIGKTEWYGKWVIVAPTK